MAYFMTPELFVRGNDNQSDVNLFSTTHIWVEAPCPVLGETIPFRQVALDVRRCVHKHT